MRQGDQDAEAWAWAEAIRICEALKERLPPDYWYEHLTQWFRHDLNFTILCLNPPMSPNTGQAQAGPFPRYDGPGVDTPGFP